VNPRAMHFASTFVLSLALVAASAAQQSNRTTKKSHTAAMTNADVIKMVQSKLPESVVIAAIQSHSSKFSTSPTDLIRLQKAGVTEAEMNAILAASSGNATASTPLPAAQPQEAVGAAGAAVPSASSQAPNRSRLPQISVVSGGASQDLPLEKTQLAQTKNKPTSMTSLAADSAVTQAFQAGIGTATTSITTHIRSTAGNSTVQQAGTIFSGMLAKRKPTMTYVWGVPNPASANVVDTVSPAFSVEFSRMPGVKINEYEPAIVKVTPAQTCRIVGATQGKQDADSDPAADWQVYSHFLEERVPAHAEKLGPGKYKLSPAAELAPGEYAVVFRPISKVKGFSGGDVARAQGDGFMFDAAWTFQISDSAQ